MDQMEINAQIKPNLKVLAKGVRIGSVDHVDGEYLKLNRKDADDRLHHWIPLSWIERIDENNVFLSHTADDYKHHRRNSKPLM